MFYIVMMKQEHTFQLLPLHVLCTNLLCSTDQELVCHIRFPSVIFCLDLLNGRLYSEVKKHWQ